MVCLLSALPGDRVTQTPAAPSPSAPVVPTISAGSDAAPAAPTVTEPAPAEDLTGWSGGLLPRADGVQAVPASTDEAANATEYPASTTGEIGIGQVVLSAVLVLVSLALTAVAGTTLWWMMHAWRTPETLDATRFTLGRRLRPSFSLLVPARHEEAVLDHTVDPLAALPPRLRDHRIVGHDDPDTAAVAHAPRGAHPADQGGDRHQRCRRTSRRR